MPQRATRLPLLANFQREASKTLAALQKEIAQREQALATLKAEAARWQTVLEGPGRKVARAEPSRVRLSKQPRLNWNTVLQELPARFTPKDVAQKTDKPVAQVYTHLSGWMKEKKIRKAKEGYQKVSLASS